MMNRVYSILTLLLTVNFLIGQPNTLDSTLQRIINDLEIPGMSVAMSKGGTLVYSNSFGYADLKKERKVDSDTKFRMASVSKLFAAAAIAKLLDEGKLFLDDPIEKYIKEYPHKDKGVTIRRILNHTSGVRHYGKGDKFIDIKNYETTDKALGIFMDDALLSEPGTTFKYSTHAFTLMAAVVERVSGMSYTDYLEKEFFQPLEMNRSGPDVKGAEDENQSKLYKGMKKSKLVDNASYKRAGGGMLSTAEDLVKFGEAHMKPGFYQQSTLDSLFRPSFDMAGTLIPTEIAMAWRVSKDSRGGTVYHHAGSMNGARSFLMLSPTDNTVVAIMTNNRELYLIDHVATAIRDEIAIEKESFPEKLTFGDSCNIDIKGNGPIYIAAIDIPEYFSEPRQIKLIASQSKNGLILKNYQGDQSVLFVELEKDKLVIVMKDSAGKWARKEYH